MPGIFVIITIMASIAHHLHKVAKTFPTGAGVYLMKDSRGQLLYVGKARNLRLRVQSYFKAAKELKNTFLMARVAGLDYVLTTGEAEALLLEASLIKKHNPRYNVRLKDDKSYPYICCSAAEDFPRFYMHRRVKKKGYLYFGPYTDAGLLKKMLRFLNREFKIRDCSNHFMKGRISPCLVHQMGYCTAPCVDQVTIRKYKKQVEQALLVLKNGVKPARIRQMEKKMHTLAKNNRFEEAARVRDSIKALSFIQAKQVVVTNTLKNVDVMAFYKEEAGFLFQTLHIRAGQVVGHRSYFFVLEEASEAALSAEKALSVITQYYMDNVIPEIILWDGEVQSLRSLEKMLFHKTGGKVMVRRPRGRVEKNLMDMAVRNAKSHFREKHSGYILIQKALKRIQQKFCLPDIPVRTECFDVSHFQGAFTVASRVVFQDGVPREGDYRRYRLKTTGKKDDYLSLQEVLARRFKSKGKSPALSTKDRPDLILVDGGKGQLQAVLEILKKIKINIPVVAIAKARVKKDFSAIQVQSTRERFFIPGRKNAVVFSRATLDKEAERILTHLRDEAHRVAITYHRRLSQKSILS